MLGIKQNNMKKRSRTKSSIEEMKKTNRVVLPNLEALVQEVEEQQDGDQEGQGKGLSQKHA